MSRQERIPNPYAEERAHTPEPIVIAIRTRVPSKWRFADMETGDVWCWEKGHFSRANDLFYVKPRLKHYKSKREKKTLPETPSSPLPPAKGVQ